MESKQKRTKVAVSVLALAGLLVFSLLAIANDDDLEPSAPPHRIVETLDEIYKAIMLAASGIPQREGYCQYFEVPADVNQILLTVPTGKRFVLLKLHVYKSTQEPRYFTNWVLTVNDRVLIDGNIIRNGWKEVWGSTQSNFTYSLAQDFPDRCVVLEPDEVLKVVNPSPTLHLTVIGYFYDV